MLQKFFNPRSIAIIGASRDEKKIGYAILKNLISSQYKGQIFLVNPKAQEIMGYKCYDKVEKLPSNVDLAVIAIPAPFVLGEIMACGEKQIKRIIIVSAGFRESGSTGLKLEKELSDLAQKYDLKILGPNCLGILDSHTNLNASFAKSMIEKGNIAFMSQSGAICSAMLDWAQKEKIGFSKFISLGNMTVLNELDFLEYFAQDKNTKAIFAYLENISDGKKFLELAKNLCAEKPLVMLKAGVTEKGKSMAMSHTGAMAEDKNIVRGILAQVNAIHCDSLEEMFNTVKIISSLETFVKKPLAVVGNAGGLNVLIADKIDGTSFSLTNFEESTSQKLRAVLPEIININNPLDILGDADGKRYSTALENLLQDKEIANYLTILTPQTMTEPMKTAEIILKLKKKYKKNIVVSFIGGNELNPAIEYLAAHNIPNFLYPENAIAALDKFFKWNIKRNKLKEKNMPPNFTLAKEKEEEIKRALQGKTGVLDYPEIKTLLDILDLPLVKGLISADLKEINNFAQKNDYPFVLKAITPTIVHKMEQGAVKLGIQNAKDLSKSFDQLIKLGDKYKTKVLIQPMISGAQELIVGAKKDNKFGSAILFGKGGIYTEIFKDVTFRVAQIGCLDAEEMLSEVDITKIFQAPGGEKINNDEIVSLLLKTSYLINMFPQIKEIDFNPVMVKDGKIYIVDARIIVE